MSFLVTTHGNNNPINSSENGTVGFYNAVMHLRDPDEDINSEDPDQTAPKGAV